MNRRAKNEMSRRQALQILGAASTVPLFRNPVGMLIDSIVGGLIQEARAEAAGRPAPRNLIVFYLTGGAPRWHFDAAHDPYKPGLDRGDNKHLINGFQDGKPGLYKREYNFSGGRTLYLPPLLASTIAPSSGKSVPMSDLLRNALVMQGVNMLSDGHQTNYAALVMPNPNGISYSGLIADASAAEIPAIALPKAPRAHKSASGNGITLLDNYAGPLGQLLSPFQRQPADAGFLSRRAALDLAMKTALQKLGTFASSSDPAAIALYSAQGKAENLLKRSLGDLTVAYSGLIDKYRKIIRKAIDDGRTGVAGVLDQAIPMTMFSDAERAFNKGVPTNIADLRDLVTGKTDIESMAENFAITEYMILNGFSQYVSAYIGNVYYAQRTAGVFETINGDEHEVGGIVSLVVNSARYRAFYACLAEFIDGLKAKGLWNESVILYGSEFNRDPRPDGSGSDHGWRGNVYTLMSGVIDGPYYVGNTSTAFGSAGPTRIGAAEVDSVVRGYVASTVATVARIQTPSSNNSSFLTQSAGGAFALNNIEPSKGVAK